MNTAIKASTQEHLDIYTVINDVLILKDGSAALVLKTTALNFDLLSEEEQDAIMYAYAGLLNSLTFPVQILIRSQRKDISLYLEFLDNRIRQTPSQKVKESVIRYRRFVKSLVKDKRVLEKHFYIIIPFSTLDLGITTSTFNPFAKRPNKPPFDTDYIIEKAGVILNPRRDHLIHQFARIGLKTHQLSNSELITFFHNIYNPEINQYKTPLHEDLVSTPPLESSSGKVQNTLRSIFTRHSNTTQNQTKI